MVSELFTIAPDAMIVADRDGRIVRANPQAERLFGYSESELRDLAVETLLPESARPAHRAHRAAYAANPRTRPMGSGQELTGRKRDGTEFPVEIALSPIQAPEGQLFLASIRDVSETQRARRALAHARYDAVAVQLGRRLLLTQNFDAAAAEAPQLIADTLAVDAAAIVVRQERVQHVRVQAAFGVEDGVIAALPWGALLADEAERRQDAQAAGLDANDGRGVTVLARDPVLAPAGFATAAVAPLYASHEPCGALVVLARRTGRLDREAHSFLQTAANLLAAAMQRIRAEEQLSHAQRLEAIGQLTGGIAHDFNNLLTVISGNLQILKDGFPGESAEGLTIASALRAAVRGGELTHKLLTFARQRRLVPRAFDPRRLLDDLGAMLRRTLGETIRLTIDYAPDIPPVFADPGQLDSALVNLALNARDAMPRGGILSISADRYTVAPAAADGGMRPGHYVMFCVRDTGIGMTPEVLVNAFEPFFTTKEHGKGSGLGLSMVHGFVRQSGGDVTIESRLGYGTCIRLHLPQADATGDANDSRTWSAASLCGKETILVVEDEFDVREVATRFLNSMGYTVIGAHDAEAAMTRLRQHPEIALVFTDIVLGAGMNGLELAEKIRQRSPDLPLLLTSGYERSAYDGASGGLLGAELLQKPYRREQLGTAVRRTLDRMRSRGSADVAWQ